MKLWRPIVEVHLKGGPTETYYAPFVTIFPSFKSQFKKLEEFQNQCRFLYIMNVLTPRGAKVEDDVMDGIEIHTRYKKLEFHPFMDIFNRIVVWCQYRF